VFIVNVIVEWPSVSMTTFGLMPLAEHEARGRVAEVVEALATDPSGGELALEPFDDRRVIVGRPDRRREH